MTIQRIRYYAAALLRNLFSLKAVASVLSVFGALWLFIEITTFFFPATVLFGTTKLPDSIRHSWPLFFTIGIAIALWQCWPKMSISHKLRGRDVSVAIVTGDIFSFPGAMIIGSNTTFDIRIPAVISERSVQGLFTLRYYDGEAQLEAEISAGLQGVPFRTLSGKRIGNSKQYPAGTCVTLRPKERIGYLIGMANINEHGTASGTFEDLKLSLAKLWEFIGTRGSKESLLIPVLGTGFMRLPQSREETVHEIIKSFFAACSERTFTDKLTIVIMPEDMLNHAISIQELGSFLEHQCNYTTFSTGGKPDVGTAAWL